MTQKETNKKLFFDTFLILYSAFNISFFKLFFRNIFACLFREGRGVFSFPCVENESVDRNFELFWSIFRVRSMLKDVAVCRLKQN